MDPVQNNQRIEVTKESSTISIPPGTPEVPQENAQWFTPLLIFLFAAIAI